jgi:hypothetical protein
LKKSNFSVSIGRCCSSGADLNLIPVNETIRFNNNMLLPGECPSELPHPNTRHVALK